MLTFEKLGRAENLKKSLREPILIDDEHKWAIKFWVEKNPSISLDDIKAMMLTAFGVEV